LLILKKALMAQEGRGDRLFGPLANADSHEVAFFLMTFVTPKYGGISLLIIATCGYTPS
jgi:hypothetical protein